MTRVKSCRAPLPWFRQARISAAESRGATAPAATTRSGAATGAPVVPLTRSKGKALNAPKKPRRRIYAATVTQARARDRCGPGPAPSTMGVPTEPMETSMADSGSPPNDLDGRIAVRLLVDLLSLLTVRGVVAAEDVASMLSHAAGKALDVSELEMAETMRALAGADWIGMAAGRDTPLPWFSQARISAAESRGATTPAATTCSGAATGAPVVPLTRSKGKAPKVPKKPRRRI